MKNFLALDKVIVTDSKWKECADKNALFLSYMEPERVLSGFYRTCKIPTDSMPYGGWEDSLIAGHGVGHYFSALGMRIRSLRGDRSYEAELSASLEKANAIVSGLKMCQERIGNGFLSAATVQDEDNPYIQFDILEGKAEGQQWVPWYALHKVLQGVLDLWFYGEIEGAKEVTCNLADWVSDRVLSWDEATRQKVLSVEYGGMNETLYLIYSLTQNRKYLEAAKVFDEPELYSELLGFKNRMKGVHANATIPKFVGFLTGAFVIDDADEVSKRIATSEKFWDTVLKNQTYATGGLGDMEHFFEDGLLDGSRTQCNAESCCCYNMIKLSQLLFMLTGKAKYLDYVERTLWNAKLGSIGPDGGYTYFNPMATGYYRLYSSARPSTNPFWCCVGTGLEDFAKFADKIYFADDGKLYIAQWISSECIFEGDSYRLRVDFESGKLSVGGPSDSVVNLRIPRWIQRREEILPENEDFLRITLSSDGTFELDFSMKMELLGLPDNASVKGFRYGPFVLCVPLGEEKWGITENAGIEVVAPAWKIVFGDTYKGPITYGKTTRKVLESEILVLPQGETVESFTKDFDKHIRCENGKFFLTGFTNREDLPLIPYCQTGNQRYGIYWYIERG